MMTAAAIHEEHLKMAWHVVVSASHEEKSCGVGTKQQISFAIQQPSFPMGVLHPFSAEKSKAAKKRPVLIDFHLS